MTTKKAPEPGPVTGVRVRALNNVLNLVHGDEVDLPLTRRVQVLINTGHLQVLSEYRDGDPEPEAVEPPAETKTLS